MVSKTTQQVKEKPGQITRDALSPLIKSTLKPYLKAYTDAITKLTQEGCKPRFIEVIHKGSMNAVVKISLTYPSIASGEHMLPAEYALKVERDVRDDAITPINSVRKYLVKHKVIRDSTQDTRGHERYELNTSESTSYISHLNILSNLSYNTFEHKHWSINPIFQTVHAPVWSYSQQYNKAVVELLLEFDKKELYYFDWKLINFVIDDGKLFFIDYDFESIYAPMSVYSTHRLTPEPAMMPVLNQTRNTPVKRLVAKLLMYISAYLSIICVRASYSLTDYYQSFTNIHRCQEQIDNDNTINGALKLMTHGEFSSIPSLVKSLTRALSRVKVFIKTMV